jgi:hypothetical protein
LDGHGLHLLLEGRDHALDGIGGVVEVEKHGRAFGRGFEHVAKTAPDVGTDDIAIIGDFPDAARSLLDVDVEVIAPKIDEDFLKLTFGIDGTHQLGLFELADGCDGAPLIDFIHHGAYFVRRLNRGLRRRLDVGLVLSWISHLPIGRELLLLFLEEAFGVVEKKDAQFLRSHLEQLELRDLLFHRRIVDGLGMKLALDVIVEAHFFDRFHIAGAGSESDAVQDMGNFGATGRGFLGRGNPGVREDEDRGKERDKPGKAWSG